MVSSQTLNKFNSLFISCNAFVNIKNLTLDELKLASTIPTIIAYIFLIMLKNSVPIISVV